MNATRRRVVIGGAWMLLTRATDRVLGLASTLVLARILAPEDFGILAICIAVVATLELLRAFGLELVLIQNQDADPSHYNTAWTLNLGICAGISLLLVVIAWPTAYFYGRPELTSTLLVLSLRPLIGGLRNIGVVDFEKSLQLQRLFWLQFGTKLGQLAVTLPLAFWLQNHWALIAGVLSSRVIEVILSYAMHPFRPRFSVVRWREMLDFSKWLLIKNALQFFTHRAGDFTIGKIAGLNALGLFTLSYEIGLLPATELTAPINRAIFPAYASRASDLDVLRRGIVEVLSVVAMIAIPVGIGIALTADLSVPLLLGDSWLDAATLVPILALSGIVRALGSNTGFAFLALGQPRITTQLAAFQLAVLVPALIFGSQRAGAMGASWAYVLATSVSIVLSYIILQRQVALTTGQLVGALYRPVVAAAVMAAVILWVARHHPVPGTTLGQLLQLGAEMAVGGAVYAAVVALLWLASGRRPGAEKMAFDLLLRLRKA